jgi:peptide/nickel transport system substrate-binding protein
VLVVALAACTGSDEGNEPTGPQILKVGTAAAFNSLDPARIAVGADAFLFPVYEPLIRRDPESLLQPGLATEWTLSDDATQLSLTLRDGVTFQDGTPFNADAVKANLDAAPDRGGSIASQLSVITSVDVVDEQHVTLNLKRPAADLLGVLASGAGMMISPKGLGSEDLGNNPVGTGPFTLDQMTQNTLSFDAWDGYWDKDRIKLDRIEFHRIDDAQTRLNAVLTGETQVSMVMPFPQVEEQKQRAPDTVVSEIGYRAYATALWVNTA